MLANKLGCKYHAFSFQFINVTCFDQYNYCKVPSGLVFLTNSLLYCFKFLKCTLKY